MQIVTVTPISKGINKDVLTYFTNKEVTIGSLISIPLRKGKTQGLVLETRDAGELKTELKSLSYNIRKIDNAEARNFLSPSFIKSCQKIADFNASSVGAVISSLVPKVILESTENLSYEDTVTSKNFYETLLIQSDDDERYATFKSIIREEFARNKSTFFCLPTTEDLLNAKNVLEKGIEQYTYILHSGLGKKDVEKIWKEVVQNPHPVLILGTGYFLSIPRNDIGAIILDKESSRSYKIQTRPFLDIRKVAELISKELNVRLILGDLFLRAETLWEEKNGSYASLSPLKFRSLTTSNCRLINTRLAKDMKKKEFTMLSPELKDLLLNAKENNEKTFMFCARKGLYPITTCSDCGTVVVCKNCNAPVVLYTKKVNGEDKNLFVCNHCGERRSSEELCVHCNGWRLNPLGIGTEKVVEEVQNLLPNTQIFLMDKDNIKTHKQAVKIRDQFYNTPGSIMIGTEMALTYLNQELENTSVVTIDSFFSIPDYQINEKVFHILLELRNLSEKNFLVQTRQEDKSFALKIFDYALKGNLLDFYRDEIEDRKTIGYPPFATYIKITAEGEKSSVKKSMDEIVEYMKPYVVSVFDAFNPGNKQKYTVHGIISIEKDKWVDRDLLKKIRGIPPNFAVRIDPASLL